MIDLSLINFRKLLLALLVIAVCITVIVGVSYFIFLKGKRPPANINQVNINGELGGQLPGANTGFNANVVVPGGFLPGAANINISLPISVNINGRVVETPVPDLIARGSDTLALVITDEPVIGLDMSPTGDALVYYDQDAAKFYRLNEDGSRALLSNKEFYSVRNVTWASDKTKAIIEYPDDSKIYYDFIQDKAVTLPKEVNSVDFSANDQKLAYKYESGVDNSWLVVSNPDGTQAQRIEPIGDKGSQVQVTWSPNQQVVALFRKSVNVSQEELFLIGLKGEDFRSVVVDGSKFEGKWSPNGLKILYHVLTQTSNYNPVLWVMDGNTETFGANQFNLGLMTWIDKCVFSPSNSNIVYCAVPTKLLTGAGLYPEIAVDTNDIIYRIDLSTGLKNIIANPILEQGRGEFSIKDLYLSRDEKYLIFVDQVSDQVYRIQLK